MYLSISQEQTDDYSAVEQLIQSAFSHAQHSDGHEHILVRNLRNSPAFIKELSLVAKADNQIVGYILLSKIQIDCHSELALAPLAVLPSYQRKGVGKALIHHAHGLAKDLGFRCVVVLGEPEYYGKFGYQSTKDFQIVAPFDVPDVYYQVLFLTDNTEIQGRVVYDQAFGLF